MEQANKGRPYGDPEKNEESCLIHCFSGNHAYLFFSTINRCQCQTKTEQ